MKKTVFGSPEKPETWIYKAENGMFIHEIEIASNKPDTEPIRILDMADMHFNYANDADKDNEEIMDTIKYRMWNANGASVKVAKRVAEYSKNFDKTVICGDVLDYLSCGAMELMDKYVWDAIPGVIVPIGGHELTREMQTGKPDKEPLEARQKVVADFWRHDIYYYSEVLGEKVMLISLDNSCGKYWEHQIPKFEADIKKARENGYIILIFQHEPISTNNPADSNAETYCEQDGTNYDFYKLPIGGDFEDNEASKKMYALITGNADVIKGIFCGHLHSAYYTEVRGSYIDSDGNRKETVIPQHNMEGVVYDDYVGHIMEITVK